MHQQMFNPPKPKKQERNSRDWIHDTNEIVTKSELGQKQPIIFPRPNNPTQNGFNVLSHVLQASSLNSGTKFRILNQMSKGIRVNRIKRILRISYLFRMIQADCLLCRVELWCQLGIRKLLLSIEQKLFLQRYDVTCAKVTFSERWNL